MDGAHSLGAGGPDLELMIFAGALLVLGIAFFFQKTVKPIVPLVLVLGAFALGGGAFALKGDEPKGETAASIRASIEIVSPAAGDEVPADEPFTLEIDLEDGTLTEQNSSSDPSAGHLHIKVDGNVVAMPSTETPEIELEPGEHEITVEFTRADHRSFEPKILDSITVTAR